MKKIFLAAVLLAANSFGATIIQTASTGAQSNGTTNNLLFNGLAFYGILPADVTSITVDVSSDATGTTNAGGANFLGGTVTFTLNGAPTGLVSNAQYTQRYVYGEVAAGGTLNGLASTSQILANSPQGTFAGSVGGPGSGATYISGTANAFSSATGNAYYSTLTALFANWNTGANGTSVSARLSYNAANSLTDVLDTQTFTGNSTVRVIFNTRETTGEVPEPSTIALIGAGLVGLASVARRRR